MMKYKRSYFSSIVFCSVSQMVKVRPSPFFVKLLLLPSFWVFKK